MILKRNHRPAGSIKPPPPPTPPPPRTVGDSGASHHEIEKLRRIVDKLPKTRNGTPVVPHKDTVWITHGLSGRPMRCFRWRLFDGRVWHVNDDPMAEWIPVSCCYDTKEQAIEDYADTIANGQPLALNPQP